MQAGNNEMVCWFAKLKHVIFLGRSQNGLQIRNPSAKTNILHEKNFDVIIGVPGPGQVRGTSATFQAVAET